MTALSMPAFLATLGCDVREGAGWRRVACPWHDDATPSASYSSEAFNCHGCGVAGDVRQVVAALGLPADCLDDLPPAAGAVEVPVLEPLPPKRRRLLDAAAARYAGTVGAAAGYLTGRGIGREVAVAAGLGVVVDPMPGHEEYTGRLVLPYRTAAGVVDLRFRSLDGAGPKYLSLPGSRPRLYNAPAVLGDGDAVVVCEGELDAVTMHHVVGVPAVGVPGASAWKAHWCRVFDGFGAVLVVGDGDDAGRRFARSVVQRLDAAAVVVPMPDGHDINSLCVEQGPDGVRSLLAPFMEEVA